LSYDLGPPATPPQASVGELHIQVVERQRGGAKSYKRQHRNLVLYYTVLYYMYSTSFTHTTPHSMHFVATHCKENPISVFLFWELRVFSPNFHIHVFVSGLYIPRIGPHISFSKIDRPILELYTSLTDI
jgi:hypothetical protein